ncbi:hypothetical protein ACHHYP_09420 [Achlya hypogyna]|uniref:Uncharacterized protein n=1 Tax=Achlya hypogyna TaxID=1202772 RepID=A0A1V9YNC2_ACHHY|nr:hypothetical protein ACHHYP_09420 [Achlya hypogyna]
MGQCHTSSAIATSLCRRRPVSMAVASVLTNRDLFHAIVMFQPGTLCIVRSLQRQWRCFRDPNARAKLILEALADATCRVDILQALYATSTRYFSRSFMNLSAGYGYLDVVLFLHTHRKNGCTTEAMDLAAANGHLAVVAFLHVHRLEGCTPRAMDLAAAHGHLDVVAFLHTHRREGCTTQAMDLAAANGHLNVVAFLHAHRSEGPTMHNAEWSTIESMRSWRYCQWTAMYGYWKVQGRRASLWRRTCSSSLRTLDGDLEADLLDEDPLTSTRPCSLDMHLVDAADAGGHTSFAMDWAIANGHLDVVMFLAEHRGLRCTREMQALAAQRGHTSVAAYTASLVLPP